MIIASSGLNVTEVAHDSQVQVKKYVCEELGLLNSYDTWHGQHSCISVFMQVLYLYCLVL